MESWINCVRCGHRYKAFISSCPRCGYSNSPTYTASKKSLGAKKWAIVAGASIGGVAVIVFLMGTILSNIFLSDRIATSNSSSEQGLSQVSLSELREYALAKINEDRAKFGMPAVALSSNSAAQIHAEELIQTKKLSHWTTDGMKPYMRYSTHGGDGYVGQNAAAQYSISDDPLTKSRLEACKAGTALLCDTVDVKKAIDTAQYNMMYNDLECCNNGHRDNILNKYHTHVSIGIAYDNTDFGFVQNFENRYVEWTIPIVFDQETNKVEMNGKLHDGLKPSAVAIYFDPPFTHETYLQNLDRISYDNGQLAAYVLPAGWTLTDSSIPVIESPNWIIDDGRFDISFSLEKIGSKYGNGVYTIWLFAQSENGESMPVTNISLIRGSIS